MKERKLPSHLEIAYSSIRVFADDGTLDLGELNFLLGLALRDGMVDEDERRVLGNILGRVPCSEVGHRVWADRGDPPAAWHPRLSGGDRTESAVTMTVTRVTVT